MTRRFEWPPADAAPAREEVLALQGIPRGERVHARIEALFERALALYASVAEPRAVVADVTASEFEGIYRGDGLNARDTPLAAMFPRADRLALVAGTIGGGITDMVRDLFHRDDLALGCMLDAIGSAAADRLGDLAGARYAGAGGVGGDGDTRVLAYSPGYCGWDVSGQRALFAALQPETIGITLNASCVMLPLKSISGVLVVAAARVHIFHPTYAFCGRCRDKPCRERMARVANMNAGRSSR